MASLTKNQLINELVNHGVKLPAAGTKKEKLVQMYEEHVSPIQTAAGEFSSDDEAEKRLNGDQGSVSSSMADVTYLSDEELLAQLKAHGAKVGPIVGSTRRLYERKLANLLDTAPVPAAQNNIDKTTTSSSIMRTVTVTNGTGADHEDFSDSDTEEPIPVRTEPSPRKEPSPRGRGAVNATSDFGMADSLRQRHVNDAPYGYYSRYSRATVTSGGGRGADLGSGESDFSKVDTQSVRPVYLRNWDDTPSPRRGVHDVRGSYNKEDYLTKSSASPNYGADRTDGRSFWADLDPKPAAGGSAGRRWLRPLVKLCMLLLLIAAGVYCYQNYSDSASIESLQEAARAAVERAAAQMERLRQGGASPEAAAAPPAGA